MPETRKIPNNISGLLFAYQVFYTLMLSKSIHWKIINSFLQDNNFGKKFYKKFEIKLNFLAYPTPLSASRPTRRFGAAAKVVDEAADKEMKELREARAARLAFIQEEEKKEKSSADVEDAVKAKKKQEAERLAEEK